LFAAFLEPDEPPLYVLARFRELQPRWMRDALCREYPRELFFPEVGSNGTQAKAICARCLVRAECLEFALSDQDARLHGVWGGTSPQDRKKLRRAAAA
jgi:WhiB family redox-sensing transcriptional regulator